MCKHDIQDYILDCTIHNDHSSAREKIIGCITTFTLDIYSADLSSGCLLFRWYILILISFGSNNLFISLVLDVLLLKFKKIKI